MVGKALEREREREREAVQLPDAQLFVAAAIWRRDHLIIAAAAAEPRLFHSVVVRLAFVRLLEERVRWASRRCYDVWKAPVGKRSSCRMSMCSFGGGLAAWGLFGRLPWSALAVANRPENHSFMGGGGAQRGPVISWPGGCPCLGPRRVA